MRINYIVILLIFLAHESLSQVPNELDLFFGDSGKVEIDIDEYDYLTRIKAQDSVIYFAGYTGNYDVDLNYDAIVGRIDYLGNLDTTFNDSGYIRFDFPGDNHSSITDISIGDSGIYFIGSSLDYGVQDTLHLFVGKINFSGEIDTSFADSGFFTPDLGRYDVGSGISVLPNEQILFCGASENIMTLTDHALMGRLLPNGSLDTTFGTTGIRIWDSNGELVDSLVTELYEKHGSGGYLNEITIVENNYFFTGNYRPGTNNMCLMIMVKENGDINLNYAGLGYRVFELSPNNENEIVSNYFDNDTLYSLINVEGNNYGHVTLFIQDTSGTQLSVPNFNVPDWIVKTKDMELTPNGEIAVSAYAVTELTTPSIDSEGFLVINMNKQGVYNSSYADAGIFLEGFDSDESGLEDLVYTNGELFAGGYVSKMVPGNVFDFSFTKLIYNPALGNSVINNSNYKMFPNPVDNVLSIELTDTDYYKLELLSLTGNLLLQKQLITNSFRVDVSDMPNGIYFITVTNLATGNTQTEKVIVE